MLLAVYAGDRRVMLAIVAQIVWSDKSVGALIFLARHEAGSP